MSGIIQDIRDIKVNSIVKNFAHLNVLGNDLEKAIFFATSNDREVPDSVEVNRIAEATNVSEHYDTVMKKIWDRIVQKPKDWKIVYKVLNLIEAVLRSGAARCIDEVRQNEHVIKGLLNFDYTNTHQIDCGVNVREKAKDLLDKLSSDDILRDMRADARRLKERISQGVGNSVTPGQAPTRQYASSSTRNEDAFSEKDLTSESGGGGFGGEQAPAPKKKKKKAAAAPSNFDSNAIQPQTAQQLFFSSSGTDSPTPQVQEPTQQLQPPQQSFFQQQPQPQQAQPQLQQSFFGQQQPQQQLFQQQPQQQQFQQQPQQQQFQQQQFQQQQFQQQQFQQPQQQSFFGQQQPQQQFQQQQFQQPQQQQFQQQQFDPYATAAGVPPAAAAPPAAAPQFDPYAAFNAQQPQQQQQPTAQDPYAAFGGQPQQQQPAQAPYGTFGSQPPQAPPAGQFGGGGDFFSSFGGSATPAQQSPPPAANNNAAFTAFLDTTSAGLSGGQTGAPGQPVQTSLFDETPAEMTQQQQPAAASFDPTSLFNLDDITQTTTEVKQAHGAAISVGASFNAPPNPYGAPVQQNVGFGYNAPPQQASFW